MSNPTSKSTVSKKSPEDASSDLVPDVQGAAAAQRQATASPELSILIQRARQEHQLLFLRQSLQQQHQMKKSLVHQALMNHHGGSSLLRQNQHMLSLLGMSSRRPDQGGSSIASIASCLPLTTAVSAGAVSAPTMGEDLKSDKVSDDSGAQADDMANDTFPYKLYRILVKAEHEGKEHIVSFLPHGNAFCIHRPREFVSDVLSEWFTTTRMSSFQRQLNLYGFRRITEGHDKGGYRHDFFKKGRPGLLKKIQRKRSAVRPPPHLLASWQSGIRSAPDVQIAMAVMMEQQRQREETEAIHRLMHHMRNRR